jgi:hypothetical protein
MKRVCAESALVVDMTGASIRLVGVGATVGVDGSRGRSWWILVERSHVRVPLQLGFAVGHIGGELCYARRNH